MNSYFKINALLSLSLFCGMLSAQTFKSSDFFESKKTPDLEEVEKNFKALQQTLSTATLNTAQKRALEKLDKSFKTETTPAKFIVSFSEGPRFKAEAEELKNKLNEENDFHEEISYLQDQWDDIIQICGAADYNDYPDDDLAFEDVVRFEGEETKLIWNSIKSSPQAKSAAYLLYTVFDIQVKKSPQARQWTNCSYPLNYSIIENQLNEENEVVFMNDTPGLSSLIKTK